MNSLREENTKSLKLFRLILISGCMREFRFYRRSPVAFEELNSVASVSSSKIVAKKNERERVFEEERTHLGCTQLLSRCSSVLKSFHVHSEVLSPKERLPWIVSLRLAGSVGSATEASTPLSARSFLFSAQIHLETSQFSGVRITGRQQTAATSSGFHCLISK